MTRPEHISSFTSMLGPKGVVTDQEALASHLREWRDKYFGKTQVMLAPATGKEVAAVVSYCNEQDIKIVPQGGNTGLVGGSLPGLGAFDEILLSTKRMHGNPKVDAANLSITAPAGTTVAELQQAAAEQGLLFPLSLASEGSCTVGGIVSTNAGGVHVLRYGTTRDLTLGVEAVLPNGENYNGLSGLRKDNTGYALDQLFIGAEGTLGVVTQATFRLFPAEVQKHTLWLAVASPADAVELLSKAQIATGSRVSVFEILPHIGLSFVLRHIPGTRNPLADEWPWYVLIEVASSCIDKGLITSLEQWLEDMMGEALIQDGAIASSSTQADEFWKLRESMSEAQKHEGRSIKHDISVPVSNIAEFMEQTTPLLEARLPGCRVTPFGHVGDGNLHYNVMQPIGADPDSFMETWEEMQELVHDQVMKFGGSISAEHGIGSLKKYELARTADPVELAAMRQVKQALDPKNIMNPNVLFT